MYLRTAEDREQHFSPVHSPGKHAATSSQVLLLQWCWGPHFQRCCSVCIHGSCSTHRLRGWGNVTCMPLLLLKACLLAEKTETLGHNENKEVSHLFLHEWNVTLEGGYIPDGAGWSRNCFTIRINVSPLFPVLPWVVSQAINQAQPGCEPEHCEQRHWAESWMLSHCHGFVDRVHALSKVPLRQAGGHSSSGRAGRQLILKERRVAVPGGDHKVEKPPWGGQDTQHPAPLWGEAPPLGLGPGRRKTAKKTRGRQGGRNEGFSGLLMSPARWMSQVLYKRTRLHAEQQSPLLFALC